MQQLKRIFRWKEVSDKDEISYRAFVHLFITISD